VEATDKIEAAVNSLLMPEEPQPTEAPQEELAPEAEMEAQETEALDNDTEAEAEVEEAVEVEAEEDDTAQEEAPSKYTVKVDGKEIEVTLDDLKRSFSGQAYIQRGMQEAAEARKAATELYQTLQTEQAKFMQVVQTIQEQGFKAPPQAPDMAMMDKDPIGYMQADARYRKELADFQTQQVQIQQTAMAHHQMQEKALAEFVADQGKLLQSRIPEFADKAKAREITSKIRQTASEAYGFTDEELGGIVDARHVQVLYDAMKYRQLQAARTKQAPIATKSIKPVARRAEPQQIVRKKQIETARKGGGKPEAFIDLLFRQ
jgi:hypothetical protein